MKIANIVKAAVGALTPKTAEVEKAAATFISRPVLNAQKWHDWAVKWGVPNVVPAAEMHVTQMASDTALMAPLVERAMNISAAQGVFAFFGEQDDCLVFTFSAWDLYDRWWDLLSAGATPTWPSYRPHLTLSYDAAGFTLPDDAMTDVPGMIVLGPEKLVTGQPDPSDQLDPDDETPAVLILDIACSAAAGVLEAERDKLPLMAAYDLADIAKGKATAEVVKRIAGADWAPAELKALSTEPAPVATPVRKRVEVDYTVKVSALPEQIQKTGFGAKARDISKSDGEEVEDQIVYGIASVSTVNGELVKDLHGDEVTTRALVEFNRSIISGSRAGKFEHLGDECTSIVGGLVLTEDWQKSLGIDLGFEPYLVEIHVPGAQDWAEVKEGDWELSIAGTMWHWEETADA